MSYQSILAKDCNINNSKIRGGGVVVFLKSVILLVLLLKVAYSIIMIIST